jgi:septum formation protein
MYIPKRVILASRSPRRQQLFRQIGISFEVAESSIEEKFHHAKTPQENALHLSLQKAEDVARRFSDAIIIGADTIVVLDSKILGKPANEQEAEEMLRELSNKTHKVYTGFTLYDKPSNKFVSDYEMTEVTFRHLTEEEIDSYVRTGSPMDKAGAYGIQDDYGAVFVEKINGCFYNVVGFPLTKFYISLKQFLKALNLT